MELGRTPATIERVRDPASIKRYTLVQHSSLNGNGRAPEGVKRYSLARVGVTPRSALGMDRHERLEQIADAERQDNRS
jgi:hypothetical protein